jgi:hypothetical protein
MKSQVLSSRLPHPVQVPKKINNLLGILNRRTASVSGSVKADSEIEETLVDQNSEKKDSFHRTRGKYSSTQEMKKRPAEYDKMLITEQHLSKEGKSFNTLSFAGEEKSLKSSRSHTKNARGDDKFLSNQLISSTYDGRTTVVNNPINLSRIKPRGVTDSLQSKGEISS